MILEYKMERTDNGLRTPQWIEDGGYFQKGRTFIGWSTDEIYRDYFIPDSVRELTQAELVKRAKSLGLTKMDDNTHEEIALTDAEIETLVNDWVNARANRNIALLQATRVLYGDSFQDPVAGDIYVRGEALTPQQLQEVTAKVEEIEEQAKIEKAYKALQTLCDVKTREAKNYINGSKVTAEQLARYEEKYQTAKAFKADGSHSEQLQLEADLVGLTVTALADLIIAKGDAYKQALVTFNARIEAFRVRVAGLIATDQVDKANEILELAKDFGVATSDDDVKALFV